MSNHKVIMLIWWLHVTCKWFLAWPLCDLINFLRIKCKKNSEKPFACHMWSAKGFSACLWFDQIFNSVFSNVQKVLKIFKTYGFAIWEWLFGMGTIFEKLLHKHSCICQNVKFKKWLFFFHCPQLDCVWKSHVQPAPGVWTRLSRKTTNCEIHYTH